MNFVVERLAIEALASETRARRISALNNEAWYDSVKDDPFVVALCQRKSDEHM